MKQKQEKTAWQKTPRDERWKFQPDAGHPTAAFAFNDKGDWARAATVEQVIAALRRYKGKVCRVFIYRCRPEELTVYDDGSVAYPAGAYVCGFNLVPPSRRDNKVFGPQGVEITGYTRVPWNI